MMYKTEHNNSNFYYYVEGEFYTTLEEARSKASNFTNPSFYKIESVYSTLEALEMEYDYHRQNGESIMDALTLVGTVFLVHRSLYTL